MPQSKDIAIFQISGNVVPPVKSSGSKMVVFLFFFKLSKMVPNAPKWSYKVDNIICKPFCTLCDRVDHFDHFHSENYNRAVHPLIIFKKAIVTISKLETEVRGSRKHLLLYIIPVLVMV